jgi:hypothetical protein
MLLYPHRHQWVALPQQGLLRLNGAQGKPSLSGEPECLSLPRCILFHESTTGKEAALPPLATSTEVSAPEYHEP